MVAKRSFGRAFIADSRDYKYRRTKRKGGRKSRIWDTGIWIGDQGVDPFCVGYAYSHWLHSYPIRQFLNPDGIYRIAQFLDEWEGENYEGTSVRAGAKVLSQLGFISRYEWAKSSVSLQNALFTVGPVVVGTNWYEGMMEPDENNTIDVTGDIVGGHAYLLYSVNLKTQKYGVKNSWSSDWGENGKCTISFEDFNRLIGEDGEICVLRESRPNFINFT